MEPQEEEAVVLDLKRQLEDEDLNPEQKVLLLNNGLNSESHTCLSLPSVSLCLLGLQITTNIFLIHLLFT